jgi:hypothetical protein
MERFLRRDAVEHTTGKESSMSDMIEAPKITVTLRTDHVDPEVPPLGFIRWKLVAPDASDPPCSAEGTP